MKWVKIRDGRYKLVEDDDPREADQEFAKRKIKKGMPYFFQKPSWIDEQRRLMDKGDQDGALRVMEEGRKKATGRDRKWDEDRKKYLKKSKPDWVKRGRNTKELTQI